LQAIKTSVQGVKGLLQGVKTVLQACNAFSAVFTHFFNKKHQKQTKK
jgi:hypothetical protein